MNCDLFDELSGIWMQLIVGKSVACRERSELIVILIDTATSPQILAPADGDELRQWLDMIDGMKGVYQQT